MRIAMNLQVDAQSPIPIRRQLAEQLKHAIESGGVPRDQALPSIRELAAAPVETAHNLEHSIANAGLPNIVLVGACPAESAALGRLVRRGGHGPKADITLGLIGSIGLSWLFRAVGVFPNAGLVTMAFVAFLGAAVLLVLQRKLRPTGRPGDTTGTIWRWGFGAVLAALAAWMILAPAGRPAATTDPVIEDKTYAVTPAAMKVKAGLVTGEMTNIKVTERVEKGSDRVVSPAKLTAILQLKNSSANQTVRLVAGKIQYIDGGGQPIKLEDMRTEPTRFVSIGRQ